MGCKCKNCECGERDKFYSSFEDGIPFVDQVISENQIVRFFSKDTPDHLLKWHTDEEEREVKVINDSDWKFQMDNELPVPLQGTLNIPKGVHHRILKGTTDLYLQINKKWQ
jgi:hypothetical protein